MLVAASLAPAVGGDSFRAISKQRGAEYQRNRLVRQVDLAFGRKGIHLFHGSVEKTPQLRYLTGITVDDLSSLGLVLRTLCFNHTSRVRNSSRR